MLETSVARYWLPFAGLAAAGLAGMATPHLGAGTLAALLAGGAALLAALLSGYAALLLLALLLLLPVDLAGPLPAEVNATDVIYAAGLAGLALRALSNERAHLSPLSLALIAFIVTGISALTAGILTAGEAQRALSHFRGLFGYALIPLLVLSVTREQRRALLWLLCGAGILTAARGVLSWAQLNGLVHLSGVLQRIASPDTDDFVGAVPALAGDFGYLRAWAGSFEGNTLGAFVVLLLPVAAYLAWRSGSVPLRLAVGAGAILLLVALFVSYSRGAYLGLAATALPAVVILCRQRPLAAAALTLGGIALLVFLVSHLPGAEDRLVTLASLSEDPTVQHRQLVYGEVLDSLTQSPIWGIGLGTSVADIGTGADSLYLFLPLRGGLLVTAAFVALCWIAGRRLLAALRAGRLTGLDLAVAAGLWGFAVHSIVDYTLWNPKVALTVWLLIGVLMAAALDRRQPSSTAPPDIEPLERRKRGQAQW